MKNLSYYDCLQIEDQGYELIRPYLKKNFDEFVYVQGKRRADFLKAFQINYGDLIAKKNNELVFIDLKTETQNKYGNFFLETWSNKARGKPGWFMPEGGVRADYLYYIFLDQKNSFYIIDLPKARTWAFADNRLHNYPEKRQNKYDQLNDTWGRCVKINDAIASGIAAEIIFLPDNL